MKKQFIQKLSIAMAAALTMTSVAQVPVSAAAKDMKMDKSSKILYLNEDNSSKTGKTYDFSIKNKPKNYKNLYTFSWYADDEAIVSVKKGGVVTAKKVGKTKVYCTIKNKKGKTVANPKATVEVKANAATVVITNLPEDLEMAPGESVDFNRTMKNFKGGKATDKTQWIVSANEEGTETTDVATVDSKGVVTTAKAGEFYLTARCYQSAKYKERTTASQTIKITVKASITNAENSAYNEVKLTFNDDMSKVLTDKNLTITNANGIKQYINGAPSFDATGKVATVKMYTDLTNDAVYKVAVDGMDAVDFTAKIGAPAKIEITSSAKVKYNEKTDLKYVLKDAAGVALKPADDKVTFKITNDDPTAFIDNKQITCYELNKVNTVVAVYATGTYEAGTGKEIEITSEPLAVTCLDNIDADVNGAPVCTVTDKANGSQADYSKIVARVAKGDTNKYIQAKYNKKDSSDTFYSNNGDTKMTFESTDTSKLIVGADGKLLPVSVGDAAVLVKYNGTIVGSFVISVGEERKSVSIEIADNKTSASITNSSTIKDSVAITVNLKDQYGDEYDLTTESKDNVSVTLLSKPNNATVPMITVGGDGKTVTFGAENTTVGGFATKGEYRYKLERESKSVYFTLNVQEAQYDSSRVIVTSKTTSVDAKVDADANATDGTGTNVGATSKKVAISLVNVAKNGVQRDLVTDQAIKYTVKNVTTNATIMNRNVVDSAYTNFITTPDRNNQFTISAVVNDAGTIKKLPAGTYVVTAERLTSDGSYVDNVDTVLGTTTTNVKMLSYQFVVKDSQEKCAPTRKTVNFEAGSTRTEIVTKLKDCFELSNKSNSREIYDVDFDSTVTNYEVDKTYDIVVKKITTKEKIGNLDLYTDFYVAYPMKVKIK